VKAANAGALPRYFGFGRGLSVLTSVTDHYATFGTKVIPASAREGLFALDEIFALRDRDSELAIAGHTTDTAGFTDLLFGVYDVVGLGFSPRIRDLADQRLWRLDDTALPDLVAPLMVNRVNAELIAAHWDDLLRLGASIYEGAVLPSLLLTKLQAFPRQNALARALQEHGRLVKTLFILRYLQRPEMRRRVGSQLNKGGEPQRATGDGQLRPRRRYPPPPARGPGGPGPVPHLGRELHRRFQRRAPPLGRGSAAGRRVRGRRRRRRPCGADHHRAHLGPRSLLLRPRPPTEGPQAGPGASRGAPAPTVHGQQAPGQGAEGLSVDLRRCPSGGCVGF
jgi:hypothetical protein